MIKNQKVRAQRANSAKPVFERRTHSPNDKKVIQKKGRVYTQTDEILRGNRSKVYTSFMSTQLRLQPDTTTKQAQQLAQQNFHLKTQLNTLGRKFNLQRSKIEIQSKKNIIYSKKLGREFQKEMYWSTTKNNDYMITGIKHQYEKMKQMYLQKSQQCEMIRQTMSFTQIQELQAYCKSLQTQNRILVQNIEYLKHQRSNSISMNSYKQQDTQYLFVQEHKLTQKYLKKIQNLQKQFKQQQKTTKQQNKKITFLQKLIIQKQNNEYHSNKKAKIIERQKVKLINQLKQLENQIKDHLVKFQIERKQLNHNHQKQLKAEIHMFQKAIRDKNLQVQKYQRQIGYLSTLLSYWKPLDELDKINVADKSSQKDKTISANSISVNQNETAHKREASNTLKTSVYSGIQEQNLFEANQSRNTHKISNSQQFMPLNSSQMRSITHRQNESHKNSQSRPHKSNKKWSNQAKKLRKVNISQVQHLGELIRFKMIGLLKPLQQVSRLFYFQPFPNSQKLNQQYISMKQIKDILISQPFKLRQEQAYLLSRYIIEDQTGEFVYCHQGNQLERTIVTSIFKAIVGSYHLFDNQLCQNRWKQIKHTYSHNMQLALRSICPKGLISKDKFLQLIVSLGIEMEEFIKEFLIGRMIGNSKSLNELSYQLIFTQEQKIE